MKALALILIGGLLLALGLIKLGPWGSYSLAMMGAGVIVGLFGLIMNHRDHTKG